LLFFQEIFYFEFSSSFTDLRKRHFLFLKKKPLRAKKLEESKREGGVGERVESAF